MDDNKLISVILLCYNYQNLMERALNAIREQESDDFEVIFVDNASTDSSAEIAKNFIRDNPQISMKIVSISENKGPINGYNIGLQNANGKYIMIHDIDDWMQPNCIEELARKARETDADVVAGRYQEVMPDGKVSRRRTFPIDFDIWTLNQLQCVLFKKSIIDEHNLRFDVDSKAGDLYYICQYGIYYKSAAKVDKILYNYLINPNSVSNRLESSWNNDEIKFFWMPMKVTYEIFEFIFDLCNKTNNDDVKLQLQYTAEKNFFELMHIAYKNLSNKDADRVYDEMKDIYTNEFNFRFNHKYVRPFFNHRTLLDRLGTWLLSIIAKTKLIKIFFRLLSIMSI